MIASISRCSIAAVVAVGLLGAAQAETWRGWLSDEQCARSRASGGIYTGTNPDCARKCVGDGANIVLIDADHTAIVNIGNQSPARQNVGDYVEIQGSFDAGQNLLHIDSLRLISKGVANCSRRVAH